MAYAANIADLTKYKDNLAVMMILQPELSKTIVDCEPGRIDGGGALFVTSDEQAGALIEVLRKRIAKHELRFYHSKTGKGGWERV